MYPEANIIPVSIQLMNELLNKATRYDVIRNSIIHNIKSGKSYNIVDSELVRLVTDTLDIRMMDQASQNGGPEEDDGK